MLFNYIGFSQHNNKLTTIIFIVYSYMFRLTWVIFRLELYLFAMSLCSFWDPKRWHVFYIDVIYITAGCNKCNFYDKDIQIPSKHNKIYYTLPLPGYMFRLLRVISRPSNELTQDYLIPSSLWDPEALRIFGVIVLWVHVCYYSVYGHCNIIT